MALALTQDMKKKIAQSSFEAGLRMKSIERVAKEEAQDRHSYLPVAGIEFKELDAKEKLFMTQQVQLFRRQFKSKTVESEEPKKVIKQKPRSASEILAERNFNTFMGVLIMRVLGLFSLSEFFINFPFFDQVIFPMIYRGLMHMYPFFVKGFMFMVACF